MASRSYDAVIVGAGMSGIYGAHQLLKIGLSVLVVEQGSGVGGTWFWNRYPGATSDIYSSVYRYSWDKEDLQTYPWSDNYLDAEDIRGYLNHVVDRHDLRKHIQLDTVVRSLKWSGKDYTWMVNTSRGDFVARYVVTALGFLSEPSWPNLPGREQFKGELYHTARWPETYDFAGKRVGVIGNGSTGSQVITALAAHVGSLLSFQRSPQYTVPARRKAVTTAERELINRHYDEIWARLRSTHSGSGFPDIKRKTTDVSAEERRRIYQDLWDQGNGFRFLTGSFSDLMSDEVANETACEFIRDKIAEVVRDPEKRRKLTPKGIWARRPLTDHGYYEAFNRENVDVVDVRENPIVEMTADGLVLADGTLHRLDVLICATGFSAFDGSYKRMRIEGRDGIQLDDHWKDGATTNMGVAVPGFPNLFMLLGPQIPVGNIPPLVEGQMDFVISAVTRVEEHRQKGSTAKVAFESTEAGEADWGALCDLISSRLLFRKIDSYLFGQNVDGKPRSTLAFFGGLHLFLDKLQECVDGGFKSFSFI